MSQATAPVSVSSSPARSHGRYLNVILTVNAVLLSAIAWTNLTGEGQSGAWSNSALAQTPPEGTQGIPNAGAQRQRMIQELQALRESVDGMKKQLDGGKMRVTVANVDELRAANAAAANNDRDR